MHPVVTPLTIELDSKYNVGVGRYKGKEIIPMSRAACMRFGVSSDIWNVISTKHNTRIKVAEETLQDLRPYQQEDCTFFASRNKHSNSHNTLFPIQARC